VSAPQLNQGQKHRWNRRNHGPDARDIVQHEGQKPPKERVIQTEDAQPEPDPESRDKAEHGLEGEIAVDAFGKPAEAGQGFFRFVQGCPEFPRESRHLEQDKDHGEKDQECVREHAGQAGQGAGRHLHGHAGIEFLADGLIGNLQSEPGQPFLETRGLLDQAFPVAGQIVGKIRYRGPHKDGDQDPDGKDRDHDDQNGQSVRDSPFLEPEKERRTDDRDKHGQEEGHQDRGGRLHSRNHDNKAGHRDQNPGPIGHFPIGIHELFLLYKMI